MANILVVDDDRAIALAMKRLLGHRGHDVHTATTYAGAQRCVRRYDFDAAFIDIWLAGHSGVELADWIAEAQPPLASRLIFMTGDVAVGGETRARIERLGVPLLLKPFGIAEAERALQRLPRAPGSPRSDDARPWRA